MTDLEKNFHFYVNIIYAACQNQKKKDSIQSCILSLFLISVDIFINSNNKNPHSCHHVSQQGEFP